MLVVTCESLLRRLVVGLIGTSLSKCSDEIYLLLVARAAWGGQFGDGEWTSTYCCRAGGGLVEDRGCCGGMSAEEYLFAGVCVRCWGVECGVGDG